MRRAGLSALLALALLWSSGCRREFLYAPQAPPRAQAGHVLVERPGEEARLYTIRRVQLERADGRKGDPSAAELRALRAGAPPEDVEAIAYEVDTRGEIWEDYTIPGAFGGFALGVALSFLIAYSPGADETLGLERPSEELLFGAFLAIPLGLIVGLEGMGVGALLGLWGTSGTTDLRQGGRP